MTEKKKLKKLFDGTYLIHWKYTTIISLIATVFSIVLIFIRYSEEKLNSENSDIKEQMQKVKLMSDNLKEMIDFLDIQKKRITEEQLLLENIQQQRKEIEPLLKTEKQIVREILNAQTKYERKNIWLDRAIAFFLGIASSMIATLLLSKVIRKKEKNAE
ncbi:MAG: hypothetical protein LBN27_01030 [Prevotellaceae bacterium]|jgi:hypothetical protein|nr:hypothetical protein [Prevotellaceae bacterium]